MEQNYIIDKPDYPAFEVKINFLKKSVKKMLSELQENLAQDSTKAPPIWLSITPIFKYLFNLSAEDFINIRYHTGVITGDVPHNYWGYYPPLDPEKFADELGYKLYTKELPAKYWLSEPVFKGYHKPIGVEYKGKIINKNLCRYQCCVSNLYFMDLLQDILEGNNRKICLEIGAGYGGLSYALGSILSEDTTYIIIDLPEMLMFSGSFLMLNCPKQNIYLYEKETFTPEFVKKEIYRYDYVLIPNYALGQLSNIEKIYLMINMQSFQEMTEKQIRNYLELGSSKLVSCIYSDNSDCMPLNDALKHTSVSKLLNEYFDIFPQPETYEEYIKDSQSPWFSKCYLGINKNMNKGFSSDSRMKIMRWSKIYYIYIQNNSFKVDIEEIKRELIRYF